MNATAVSGIILSSLDAIQGLLPLLGPAGATAGAVTNVITTLTKIIPVAQHVAPLVGDEGTLIFQGIKNIVGNLRGTQTSAEQDAALDELDSRVDAAWDAIASKFDPDARA
jgi:hypothetical protein